MILPVYGYGNPVLREKALAVEAGCPGLKELVSDMFDTLHNAEGIGLAAPQIGKSIRLFVIDTQPLVDDKKEKVAFKRVIINPEILEEGGEELLYNEGCLSLPGIREDIRRKSVIRVKYSDENFSVCEEELTGIKARVFLHEYDHLEGILLADKISPLRKTLNKNKLNNILNGRTKADYNMIFAKKRHYA